MAELFGAAAVGVPGAVDLVAVAQEHVDAEAGAGRRVHVGAERALRRRVPLHLVADLVAVGQRLLDRPVGDDHEPRVVVVQELQPGELRRESRAAAALPFRAVLPHVVVDDELRATLEDVDESDRPVLADRVCSHPSRPSGGDDAARRWRPARGSRPSHGGVARRAPCARSPGRRRVVSPARSCGSPLGVLFHV